MYRNLNTLDYRSGKAPLMSVAPVVFALFKFDEITADVRNAFILLFLGLAAFAVWLAFKKHIATSLAMVACSVFALFLYYLADKPTAFNGFFDAVMRMFG